MVTIYALFFCIVVPFGLLWILAKNDDGARRKAKFKKALAFNVVSFFGVLIFSTIYVFSTVGVAAETAEGASGMAVGLGYLAAGISTGLGSLGAGLATGQASASAIGAISENDAIFGKAILFVALAEGIAIYGLLMSFMILNRL